MSLLSFENLSKRRSKSQPRVDADYAPGLHNTQNARYVPPPKKIVKKNICWCAEVFVFVTRL